MRKRGYLVFGCLLLRTAAGLAADVANAADATADDDAEPLQLTLSRSLSLALERPDPLREAGLPPGLPLAPPGEAEAATDAPDADPLAKLIRAGLAERQAGQYDRAREHFAAALAADPARPDVLHLLGMNDAYAKSYATALDHLEAAQKLVPSDVDVALDRARVLSWSGRLSEAGSLVDGVLADHPDNGEAWDLRARLSWYQAQPVEAEGAARKAVALDPLSTDFKLMLAQSLAAQGRYPDAADIAREIAPQRPADADVASLLQAEIDNRPRPWRVDVALAHSSFERIPLQDWRGASVQLNRQLSAADTVYGRIDNAQRFGQTNSALALGDAHVFRSGFAGYAEISAAPGATFLPNWRLASGGELRVRDDQAAVGATFLTLDASAARYNAGTSYGLTPGLIQYLNGGRAWLSVRLNNSLDANRNYLNGWGVRGDVLVGASWNLHAGYSRAPESDYVANGAIISVVRDTTFGASWQATPDFALRLDYLREDRVLSYLRKEWVLGASYRF
ncbi:MAG: YaiO family outer membrane beta-barrel protein [Pseudomonadota bacterium]|nr:YaiO family outer membrane beta-barrel protein [Pseudomonadota bacterium]